MVVVLSLQFLPGFFCLLFTSWSEYKMFGVTCEVLHFNASASSVVLSFGS